MKGKGTVQRDWTAEPQRSPEPSGAGSGSAVIVLAAGSGRRIGDNSSRPKWLLDIAGRPVADYQLAAVASSGVPITEVTVVTGHGRDDVLAYLKRRTAGPPCREVHNARYEARNNWLTLVAGLEAVPESSTVVILNSDLVAGDGIIQRFLVAAAGMSCDVLVAVDDQRPLTPEAMKVAVRRGDMGAPALTAIGKTGVVDPSGEYIGVAAVHATAVPRLLVLLRSYETDTLKHDRWYDLAFGELAADGADVRIWPTGSTRWVEVDDPADLNAAQGVPALGGHR